MRDRLGGYCERLVPAPGLRQLVGAIGEGDREIGQQPGRPGLGDRPQQSGGFGDRFEGLGGAAELGQQDGEAVQRAGKVERRSADLTMHGHGPAGGLERLLVAAEPMEPGRQVGERAGQAGQETGRVLVCQGARQGHRLGDDVKRLRRLPDRGQEGGEVGEAARQVAAVGGLRGGERTVVADRLPGGLQGLGYPAEPGQVVGQVVERHRHAEPVGSLVRRRQRAVVRDRLADGPAGLIPVTQRGEVERQVVQRLGQSRQVGLPVLTR